MAKVMESDLSHYDHPLVLWPWGNMVPPRPSSHQLQSFLSGPLSLSFVFHINCLFRADPNAQKAPMVIFWCRTGRRDSLSWLLVKHSLYCNRPTSIGNIISPNTCLSPTKWVKGEMEDPICKIIKDSLGVEGLSLCSPDLLPGMPAICS